MGGEENAGKNPRPRRAFFIDSENNIKQLLFGLENLNANDLVVVFHRNNFPKDCRAKLETCLAKVEWITCVEPRTKDSMDFQIVSEFSMRLVSESFDHGYIVSHDKGYLPALNYLARTPQREGHILGLAPNITEAISGTISDYIHFLEDARTLDDVREFFTLFMSKSAAKRVMGIVRNFIQREIDIEKEVDNVLSLNENMRARPILELPGIGTALAKRLEEVGIGTEGELRKIGAVDAWRMIREKDQAFPSKWVYTFEAALQGIRATQLDDTLKEKLRHDVEVTIPAQAA